MSVGQTVVNGSDASARGTRTAGLLYEERLGAGRRAWLWLVIAVGITFFAASPLLAPLTLIAWIINLARFRGSTVRVDHDYVWVGRRALRLPSLDVSTLGRASNAWPWRSFNHRYLGANPIWTNDSVGLRGVESGKRCWLSVGTNHREDLLAALLPAIEAARDRVVSSRVAYLGQTLSPPGWADDPWAAATHWRWWDGTHWTGYTWPKPKAPAP